MSGDAKLVNPFDRAYKEEWRHWTKFYLDRGFSLLPCGEDKRPLVQWEHWQHKRATPDEVSNWAMKNIGIVTGAISGIAVIDCDTRPDAEWWNEQQKRLGIRTNLVVQTGKGFHFYYRHPGTPVQNGTKINGRYDVRGDGGFVIAPPSYHTEEKRWYKWLRNWDHCEDLPVFDPRWRIDSRARERQPVTPTGNSSRSDNNIRDGRRYISKIYATEGQGGDRETFKAANYLRESGMSEAEAFLALQIWNKTNATPPWTDYELLHKIRCAYAK